MSQSAETAFVKFTVYWKIEWSEFNNISTKKITKSFVTAYKNVPFYWKAVFKIGIEIIGDNKIVFFVRYEDGPLPTLTDISYTVEIMQPDRTAKATDEAKFEFNRGSVGYGYSNFGYRSANLFQEKYNLIDSEPFFCRIQLKIPKLIFRYSLENPLVNAVSTPWLRNFFEQIEEPGQAAFSNAKFISQAGKVFYCHEAVIGSQSEEFAAMFRHPPADDQIKGEYEFPNLSTPALKAMIEFLYTGKATFQDLSTVVVFQVADAAEQYNLKKMKEACGAFLWKRVVEKPEDSFDIVQFTNLHRDMKYLKDRAFDVLTDNYEKFGLHVANVLARKLYADDVLITEFNLYHHRRVVADFSSK